MTVTSGCFGITAERCFGRNIIDDPAHANYILSRFRRVLRAGLIEQGIVPDLVSNPRVELLSGGDMTKIYRSLWQQDNSTTNYDAEKYVLDKLHKTPDRFSVRARSVDARLKGNIAKLGILVGSKELIAEATKVKLHVTKPLAIRYQIDAFVHLATIDAADFTAGKEILFETLCTEQTERADLAVSDTMFFDA